MPQTRKMRNLLLTIGCFVLLLVAFSKGGQAFGKEPAKPVLPSADCFAAASEAYGQAYATMEVRDLVSRADVFKSLGQTDSAIFYYARGYNRFRNDLPDKERYWCAIATLRLADVYYYAANYSLCLELYIKGLKMIEGCTRRDHIAEFYIGLGNVYWLFEDLENAGVCYENGYALSVELGDTMSQRRLANHLTGIYCYTNQDGKAREMMKVANRLNRDKVTQAYMNMLHEGLLAINEGLPDKAAHLFRQSGRYAKAHHMHPKYECSSYDELYTMYMNLGKTDSMSYYLHKTYNILTEHPMFNMLPKCLKNMARLYEQQGNLQKANLFREKYIHLYDSIFEVREVNKLRTMQVLYGAEKLNNNIDSLKTRQQQYVMTIEKQRVVIFVVGGILLLVAAVAWLIYHQRCKFRFLYKKLYTLNNELTDALEQSRARQPKPEEPPREKPEEPVVTDAERQEDKEEADVQPSDSGADDVRATQLLPEVREKLLVDIAGVMENTLEFCNAEFSLKRLATLVNSNSTYVSRAINEKYHKNFSSFLNSYRVREVCKRLKDQEHYENYTIRAIAESVGYKSQTTFIKAFKEETGMSPSVYQKIAKTEISK